MNTVSVIMGIYNCSETLPEAIGSLLNQTYPNWELVMCDDGSADSTFQVAEQYQRKHPDRILLLRNDRNMGLNYTLNKCLDAARGEYIARMDGDDLCDSTRLEKQVRFLDAHPEYAIVSSAMTHFDEAGTFRLTQPKPFPQVMDLVRGNPFCHAPAMIRAEAYRAVGGYTVDRRMLRVEDVNLWFKLYAAGYRGHNLQEPLYSMRDDRNAAARRKFRYRIHSAYTRIMGFRMLKIPLRYYPLAFRPILVGLLPGPVYRCLHRWKES